MVNKMFNQAAIDGRYFIRMGQINSRNPTARQPVTQTGIQQHHISTTVQLQEEQERVSVCACVCSACITHTLRQKSITMIVTFYYLPFEDKM